jgi:hypothetical protein
MDNDQAVVAVSEQINLLQKVLSDLDRYRRESSDWKVVAASTRMTEIKALALSGGVDLATWDGG